MKERTSKRIAILGGGPGGLFMYKRLVESGRRDVEIHIYERKGYLGAGMPYSTEGANEEHITNVSDNEIPVIFNDIADWVKTAPKDILTKFNINDDNFNEYKVLPRLFFGAYLAAQFDLLQQRAAEEGIATHVHLKTHVTDVFDDTESQTVNVETDHSRLSSFDQVVICTGHNWPKKNEGKIPAYFDSPYPPQKLAKVFNHAVAIKGSSLTAIDAIRTLARNNGTFEEDQDGRMHFKAAGQSQAFRIVMHSRNGMLPAVRFHLEDSHLGKEGLLTKEELNQHREENGGFISLDYIFEKNFKKMFVDKDPGFFQLIKDMDLEAFVQAMMNSRERVDAFTLLKLEYQEAERSIAAKDSIYWKEMLAVLSFAMNYPAKYFSAEDMLRLQKVLMPLISIVIAFVPQSSCRDLMALYDAGILILNDVGEDSEVIPESKGGATYRYQDEAGEKVSNYYQTFVDCVGQPHLAYEDFPFQGLLQDGTVSPATLSFRDAEVAKALLEQGNSTVERAKDGDYLLRVPGIAINDQFQLVSKKGISNPRIYIMAVPYIGGYNPDYSGIDFSEAASSTVLKAIFGQED
ncbi:FAD/NAD(P)-binding protein [Pedobacter sp. BAL39]|uniref:FAD/NAD(P)-binding protein n=1 Tax=Pedobacter sp. BAL39 TaxID=391596 RepID=UPI000587581A|nr:FAD/NAD(P)-binding protein [Pedobacter sp. BAL39]